MFTTAHLHFVFMVPRDTFYFVLITRGFSLRWETMCQIPSVVQ